MSTTIISSHSSHSETAVKTSFIDASVRLPVLVLFGNAIHWFFIAALLSLLLSFKLVAPGFLDGISFLTYGRLAPAARDLMLYGWASQAALATGIWLMARLCGCTLGKGGNNTLLISATILWNLAILLGTLAILAGYSTGVEWLEYPNWASAMLFLSFLLIGIWVVLLFDRRSSADAEVAQWYLVAAFCSFPWVYGTGNLLLTWKPIQASAQGIIQSWFCGSLLALWLLPVALAALYALIPRILRQPLNRSNMATLGFWLLLLLGGWNGMERLIGGPVPAWMTSVGVVAGVFFLIPVIIISMNLLGTLRNHCQMVANNLPLRFLSMGAFAFLLLGLVGALSCWPEINASIKFTGATEAKFQFWILGAITLPLFGALYEALPFLLGRHCWNERLSTYHYWFTVIGFWLLVGFMLFEGLFTGMALSDPTVSFLNIASYSYPFYLLECAAEFLLLVAASILSLNVIRALAGDYLFPKR